MNVFRTPSSAYLGVLRDVLAADGPVGRLGDLAHRSAPRGMPIAEILAYAFCVEEPQQGPIVTLSAERNEVIARYTAHEFLLYDSKTRDVNDFAAAAKFWLRIANPDGTVNSAYGYLIDGRKVCGNMEFEAAAGGSDAKMRTPWEWVIQSLRDDKDTRQAILHFSTPDHAWRGVKDFTCTLTCQFLIRKDRLFLIVNMRSNDVVRGLVYDMPWFISLMFKAKEELKSVYPNLEIGTYVHQAGSMHIYDQDRDTALKMITPSN